MEYKEDENIIYFKIDTEDYYHTATILKDNGFERLLTISAVDWIDEDVFEIFFIVHSMTKNIYLKISTRILRRENPKINSLSDLWINATLHEREAWEMFGIIFEGNKFLKPLFLENWDGPPPFTKDFNWRQYVRENFDIDPPR